MKKKCWMIILFFLVLGVASCHEGSSLPAETSSSYDENPTEGTYIPRGNDVSVTFHNQTITLENNNGKAIVNGQIINITGAGTYVFKGTLSNGQIQVNALKTEKISLILNGVSIKNEKNAAIASMSSDRTTITLTPSSYNYLSDANSYTYLDVAKQEPNACLFSKDDLTITGTGSLVVLGNFNNAIGTKNDLVISDSTIIVPYAKNNGLKGNDSITLEHAKIDIKCLNDGIKTETTDSGKGYIIVNNGEYRLSSKNDGMDAATNITINRGLLEITTGNGSSSAVNRNISNKGLCAGGDIIVNNGAIYLDTQDDGIHAGGDIIMNNGSIEISSGDDGIHSDETFTIKNGTIDVLKSNEGIEARNMDIDGGVIHIVSLDDGINIAGGSDDLTTNSRKGKTPQSLSKTCNTCTLNIRDGYIYIDARGDGIDANGKIVMTNGTVIVNGPIDNENGAIDYNISFSISGGLLIAAGSSGMAQAPSPSISSQNVVSILFKNFQSKNTIFHLENNSGEVIMTFASNKNINSLVISSPLLEQTMHNLFIGGTYEGGNEYDGLFSAGTYVSSGAILQTFTNNSQNFTISI